MAYRKTTWEDGENKYSITDQAGNVIPGFEDIKLLYTGTGGTPLSQDKMNNIEDGLSGVIAESYRTNAEQNIQLWELEAQVIQDKESLSGWQGEGMFTWQNEFEPGVENISNVTIERGTTKGSGKLSFGYPAWSSVNDIDGGSFDNRYTGGTLSEVEFSPDGMYLAIGGASPVRIYKRDGEKFNMLVIPNMGSLGTINGLSFSPDSVYLAIAHTTTPYISVLKRTGNSLAFCPPISALAGVGTCIDFSNVTSDYIAVGHSVSPFFSVLKRSGDTFTKLANPATMLVKTVYDIEFSPNDAYLAIGHADDGTPKHAAVYKRSVDTFTKLNVPTMFTEYGSFGGSVTWSPDSIYLVITASSIAPRVVVLKRSGDSFTKLGATPGDAFIYGNVGIAKFSPDGKYLIISGGASNYNDGIKVFNHSGDTFSDIGIKIHPLYSAYNVSRFSFSPDSQLLATVIPSSVMPYIASATGVLTTTLTGFIKLKQITLPEVSNSVFLLEESTISAGVAKKYEVSLNGGITWEEVPTIGEVVTLGHSGTKLVIKLSYTRAVSGVGTGVVKWVVCWAGVV